MTPVKVNIYISHAPEDKAFADKLERWLRPMRDEVNLWFDKSATIREPKPMPLPWQILLFWYRASQQQDLKGQYAKTRAAQLDRAHLYLFLTSSNSLGNDGIIKEIETATYRRIRTEGDLKPQIYPVILTPCRWKSGAFLNVTNQLIKAVREVQRTLDEAKYRDLRPEPDEARNKMWLPYLGGDDAATEFRPPQVSYPSETLGWGIIVALLLSLFRSLQPAAVQGPIVKYKNAEPAYVRPREYVRERPLMPPPVETTFRPIEAGSDLE
jgi:hypothetical protein